MSTEVINDAEMQSVMQEALSYCKFGHFDYIVSSADIPKITSMLQRALVKYARNHKKQSHECFSLICQLCGEGAATIAHDSFTQCFESPKYERVPISQYPVKFFYVLLSLTFLLPLRAAIFLAVSIYGALLTVLLRLLLKLAFPFLSALARQECYLRLFQLIMKMYCFCLGCDLHVHGYPPKYEPGMIFVANHATTLEYVYLASILPFGIVGQAHKGIYGFVEKVICKPVQPLMFERSDKSQRKNVMLAMKQHVFDPKVRSPLLIFPEGVCVNNKFVTQFKQGAFSIGAKVCPIAIKYRDCSPLAYHNSKEKSFPRYLLGIFMYQSLACDIWFLPPQEIRKEEDAAEFAHRVQLLIANTAGLIPRQWDGFLKYANVDYKMIDQRKEEFAKILGVSEIYGGDEGSSVSIHLSEG